MSEIDLDRLVVRQTYFIPIKPSNLKDAILKELGAHREEIYDIPGWDLLEEHANSFTFCYSYRQQFIVRKFLTSVKPPSLEQVHEASREYEEGGFETYFDMISEMRGSAPIELHVLILEKEKNGCLSEIECLPNLYRQVFQLKEDAEDIEMQDAYLRCQRFVKYIFQGGLGATLVTEEKKLPPRPTTQFLINDETSHQILDKMQTMLDEATGEVLICGWVGTILLPKLKELNQNKISIRIMTHKSTELKGKPGRQDVERAHSELVSLLGKDNISMSPECHFRVLVVDNKALVGSMDFNAISLTGTHREFAIYTENPEIVRSIRNYFNQIFTPLSE